MIVDSREPLELKQKLKSKKDILVVENLIECGDYLLSDGYSIERKTMPDFIASISDRRLFTQLGNLIQYENPILAIINENKWESFYFSRNRYIHNVYIGTLTTILLSYPKIKIMYFDTDNEFISFLVSLEKKLNEDGKSGCRPSPMMRRPQSLDDRKENVLCAVSGIGVLSAKKLLAKFKSVNAIANASEEELKTVEKIGDKVIKNIKETLN